MGRRTRRNDSHTMSNAAVLVSACIAVVVVAVISVGTIGRRNRQRSVLSVPRAAPPEPALRTTANRDLQLKGDQSELLSGIFEDVKTFAVPAEDRPRAVTPETPESPTSDDTGDEDQGEAKDEDEEEVKDQDGDEDEAPFKNILDKAGDVFVAPPEPTQAPTSDGTTLSFVPGFLTVNERGLRLSSGLTARVIARSGEPVAFADGSSSEIGCHVKPDFGAVFRDPDNEGGWIYVSNSEDRSAGKGGVGSFTFDANGNVTDYRMILNGTTSNCGGGPTPWHTWISCEETSGGVNWQIDPLGRREPEVIALGRDGGRFESFAYDLYGPDGPEFFVTEDSTDGCLQRFRPDYKDKWRIDPWTALHGEGTTDFLVLDPTRRVFYFTHDRKAAQESAEEHYPNSEGIDCVGGHIYFVSKKLKQMFILNLRDSSYTVTSTQNGAFDGQPDQVARILGHDDLLFFTEDGGEYPGIHARDRQGLFFTVLEGESKDETTGLAFSPDGQHMYFALQHSGTLYDVTRTDGRPFYAKTLNIKYHASGGFE